MTILWIFYGFVIVNVTDMSWHILFPLQVATSICQSAAVMALSPFQAHE